MVKFVDDSEISENNILIVDGMNLAFRWKHSGQAVFAEDFVKTVASLAKSYKCGKIVVAADQRGSLYRREIFPEYKANRKEAYANDTAEQKEASRRFFDEYERALEACDKRFILLRYSGVEADDIAAYICSKRSDFGYDQIWLISSDRDWDLLIGPNVSRFSTVTRKEQTLLLWDNPVPPADYLTYKCLIGDKGDNIPGVDGVGPKRAANIINDYGNIFDICDAIPIPGKYKYILELNKSKEQLMMNVELMDLETYSEEAIGPINVLDIDNRLS